MENLELIPRKSFIWKNFFDKNLGYTRYTKASKKGMEFFAKFFHKYYPFSGTLNMIIK